MLDSSMGYHVSNGRMPGLKYTSAEGKKGFKIKHKVVESDQ